MSGGAGIANALRRRKLANGLQVLVLPDPAVPNLAFCTAWRVGSRNERPGITGISHLFEHMMFNGARKYGPKEFDRTLESRGGYSNAWTSKDMTVYHEVVPSDALDLVLDLELDRFSDLDLSERNLRSEREVVKNERRHAVDEYPPADLDEQLHAAAFLAHPYAWPVIGWPKDIDAISLADVREYFRVHYRPANAVVAVCGDIDAEAALDAVEESLGRLVPGDPQPAVVRNEPEQSGERRLIRLREAQVRTLTEGYPVPEARSDELPALEVLQAILSDGDSSRLRRALVLEEELAIDVGLGFPWSLDPTLLTVAATLRPGASASRLEERLHETLLSLATQPPGAREMQKALNGLTAQHWRQLKTNEGRADLLCRGEILLGEAEELFRLPARYERVEVEEVARLASEIFSADKRTLAFLEPRKQRA